MLSGIQADQVSLYWPHVKGLIEKALIRTGAIENYSLESIKKALIERDMQLWLWIEDKEILAAGITQIIQYPKRKVLDIPFVGAEKMTIDQWFEGSMEIFRKYAIANECWVIRGYGRFGWIKLFMKLIRTLSGFASIHSEAAFVIEVEK